MYIHRNKGEWIFIQCILIISLLPDAYLNGACRPIQVYFWILIPASKEIIKCLFIFSLYFSKKLECFLAFLHLWIKLYRFLKKSFRLFKILFLKQ